MNRINLAGVLMTLVVLSVCREAKTQSCTIYTSSLDFGLYDPFVVGNLDSTGQVQVACTTGTTYDVYLNAGQFSGGGFYPRKLKHTSLSWYLNYNLYTDAARSSVWGDDTSGTCHNNGTGTGLGNPETYTVYGRIPGLQNVHVGNYSDSITVTVTY